MPLTSTDFAAANRHMQVIETVNRFDPSQVRGLIVTVATQDQRQGQNNRPLQVFIPINDPNYQSLLDLVQNISAANVSAAQQALSDLGLAAPAGISVTSPPSEVVVGTPAISSNPAPVGSV